MNAGYKNHIEIYTHPTSLEFFWKRLDGFKKAKGSAQFPLNKPLPTDLIKELIKSRFDLLTKY